MTPEEIRPGLRVTSLSGEFAGTVTRVTLSRWRHRLLAFWISWDHDQPPGAEASHSPGDAQYLLAAEERTRS
jgi:hypothetical protein